MHPENSSQLLSCVCVWLWGEGYGTIPLRGWGCQGPRRTSHHPTEDQDEGQPLPRVPANGRMAQMAQEAAWLRSSQDVIGAIIIMLIIASP